MIDYTFLQHLYLNELAPVLREDTIASGVTVSGPRKTTHANNIRKNDIKSFIDVAGIDPKLLGNTTKGEAMPGWVKTAEFYSTLKTFKEGNVIRSAKNYSDVATSVKDIYYISCPALDFLQGFGKQLTDMIDDGKALRAFARKQMAPQGFGFSAEHTGEEASELAQNKIVELNAEIAKIEDTIKKLKDNARKNHLQKIKSNRIAECERAQAWVKAYNNNVSTGKSKDEAARLADENDHTVMKTQRQELINLSDKDRAELFEKIEKNKTTIAGLKVSIADKEKSLAAGGTEHFTNTLKKKMKDEKAALSSLEAENASLEERANGFFDGEGVSEEKNLASISKRKDAQSAAAFEVEQRDRTEQKQYDYENKPAESPLAKSIEENLLDAFNDKNNDAILKKVVTGTNEDTEHLHVRAIADYCKNLGASLSETDVKTVAILAGAISPVLMIEKGMENPLYASTIAKSTLRILDSLKTDGTGGDHWEAVKDDARNYLNAKITERVLPNEENKTIASKMKGALQKAFSDNALDDMLKFNEQLVKLNQEHKAAPADTIMVDSIKGPVSKKDDKPAIMQEDEREKIIANGVKAAKAAVKDGSMDLQVFIARGAEVEKLMRTVAPSICAAALLNVEHGLSSVERSKSGETKNHRSIQLDALRSINVKVYNTVMTRTPSSLKSLFNEFNAKKGLTSVQFIEALASDETFRAIVRDATQNYSKSVKYGPWEDESQSGVGPAITIIAESTGSQNPRAIAALGKGNALSVGRTADTKAIQDADEVMNNASVDEQSQIRLDELQAAIDGSTSKKDYDIHRKLLSIPKELVIRGDADMDAKLSAFLTTAVDELAKICLSYESLYELVPTFYGNLQMKVYTNLVQWMREIISTHKVKIGDTVVEEANKRAPFIIYNILVGRVMQHLKLYENNYGLRLVLNDIENGSPYVAEIDDGRLLDAVNSIAKNFETKGNFGEFASSSAMLDTKEERKELAADIKTLEQRVETYMQEHEAATTEEERAAVLEKLSAADEEIERKSAELRTIIGNHSPDAVKGHIFKNLRSTFHSLEKKIVDKRTGRKHTLPDGGYFTRFVADQMEADDEEVLKTDAAEIALRTNNAILSVYSNVPDNALEDLKRETAETFLDEALGAAPRELEDRLKALFEKTQNTALTTVQINKLNNELQTVLKDVADGDKKYAGAHQSVLDIIPGYVDPGVIDSDKFAPLREKMKTVQEKAREIFKRDEPVEAEAMPKDFRARQEYIEKMGHMQRERWAAAWEEAGGNELQKQLNEFNARIKNPLYTKVKGTVEHAFNSYIAFLKATDSSSLGATQKLSSRRLVKDSRADASKKLSKFKNLVLNATELYQDYCVKTIRAEYFKEAEEVYEAKSQLPGFKDANQLSYDETLFKRRPSDSAETIHRRYVRAVEKADAYGKDLSKYCQESAEADLKEFKKIDDVIRAELDRMRNTFSSRIENGQAKKLVSPEALYQQREEVEAAEHRLEELERKLTTLENAKERDDAEISKLSKRVDEQRESVNKSTEKLAVMQGDEGGSMLSRDMLEADTNIQEIVSDYFTKISDITKTLAASLPKPIEKHNAKSNVNEYKVIGGSIVKTKNTVNCEIPADPVTVEKLLKYHALPKGFNTTGGFQASDIKSVLAPFDTLVPHVIDYLTSTNGINDNYEFIKSITIDYLVKHRDASTDEQIKEIIDDIDISSDDTLKKYATEAITQHVNSDHLLLANVFNKSILVAKSIKSSPGLTSHEDFQTRISKEIAAQTTAEKMNDYNTYIKTRDARIKTEGKQALQLLRDVNSGKMDAPAEDIVFDVNASRVEQERATAKQKFDTAQGENKNRFDQSEHDRLAHQAAIETSKANKNATIQEIEQYDLGDIKALSTKVSSPEFIIKFKELASDPDVAPDLAAPLFKRIKSFLPVDIDTTDNTFSLTGRAGSNEQIEELNKKKLEEALNAIVKDVLQNSSTDKETVRKKALIEAFVERNDV